MSRRVTFHLLVSGAVLVTALIVNWLLIGETSPFREYFFWHDGLPSFWGKMNFIPAIVSAIASGNIHGGNEFVFYLVLAVQWSFIGLLLSFAVKLFRMKHEKPTALFE